MVFKRAYCVFALAEMQSFLQLPQDEIQERYNVLGRVNIAANPKSERIVALLYCNGRSCVSALFKVHTNARFLEKRRRTNWSPNESSTIDSLVVRSESEYLHIFAVPRVLLNVIIPSYVDGATLPTFPTACPGYLYRFLLDSSTQLPGVPYLIAAALHRSMRRCPSSLQAIPSPMLISECRLGLIRWLGSEHAALGRVLFVP